MQHTAHVIDLVARRIVPATVHTASGRITALEPLPPGSPRPATYLLPGFTDAHVHIESSLLAPVEFARLAVVHGTVASVSDPHEIANVLGLRGVSWMIDNARLTPFHVCFGAPSCVPATAFETAGAALTPADVQYLFEHYPDEIGYLAEVMNYPGVLSGEADLLAKISLAQRFGRPIDGHAPGLRGEAARRYAAAGCQTDHECVSEAEARDKLAAGMKILIREGSAALNFDALIGLLPHFADRLMFCSDDKHPDSLVEGHINLLVKRALRRFPDCLFEVLQVACLNPVRHYNLPCGLLQPGDRADFIEVDNLQDFNILRTFIGGACVAENARTRLPSHRSMPLNAFVSRQLSPADFRLAAPGLKARVRVIAVADGQLVTTAQTAEVPVLEGNALSDPQQDVLKMAVVNRYAAAPPALGFISKTGLKHGAMASSVAHDSHNIVAVGTDDESLCRAVNAVMREQGGLAAVGALQEKVLPLPIAGLMSDAEGYAVAEAYTALDGFARTTLGSSLSAPFMSLSFMALLVIPSLKLSDRGLFDGQTFSFTDVLIS